MPTLHPIYTERRECQDCHKCIRECPVKAIRVQDGYARVVPELCILCGNCMLACPSSAKQVRDDLPKAKALLSSGRRVVVSLAPSFVAQFPGVRPGQLIHALKKLGFRAVSETALGAQQVSASVLSLMRSEPKQIWISSACPVVVDFIAKYHPECQTRCLRRPVAAAHALQDAARALWRRHRDCLYRALHRQEDRGRSSIPSFSMWCSRSRISTAGWQKRNIRSDEIAGDDRTIAFSQKRPTRARSIPSTAE